MNGYASGKTSFYRARFADTHVHISKDLFKNNKNPGRRQLVLLDDALREGRSTVIDNTNPGPADRAPLIALARALRARVVGYFFDSSVEDCLGRNRQRQGKARVPVVALYATRKKLEPPSRDEGFDRLFRVRMAEQGGWEVAPLEEERQHEGES